jgi:hypothetical protein
LAPLTSNQAIGTSGQDDVAGGWVLAKDIRQADGTVVTSGTIRCPSPSACAADNQFGLRPGAYNHQIRAARMTAAMGSRARRRWCRTSRPA